MFENLRQHSGFTVSGEGCSTLTAVQLRVGRANSGDRCHAYFGGGEQVEIQKPKEAEVVGLLKSMHLRSFVEWTYGRTPHTKCGTQSTAETGWTGKCGGALCRSAQVSAATQSPINNPVISSIT